MKQAIVSLTALLCVVAASAEPDNLRTDLARQRAQLEQQFTAERATCQARFAVSECLEDVRRRERLALAPIVQRERELVAEERRVQAAAQSERVRERELAAAQEEAQRREKMVVATLPSPAAAPASHAARAPAPEQVQQVQTLRLQADESQAAERARQRTQREAEARRRQQEHDRREAARSAKKAPAASLPPSSASSR